MHYRRPFGSIWLMKKSIFILAIILMFSAGSASATNPLLDFFGGQSGLIVEEEVVGINSQASLSSNGESGRGFFSFIVNLFGFGNIGDTSSTNTEETVDGWIEITDEEPLLFEEDLGPTPAFTCLPNTVVADEPVLMFWQCLDGSEEAYIWNDYNDEELAVGGMGSSKVSRAESATYFIDCLNGTQTQCSVDVIEPIIALVVSTSTVPMWEKVNISWNSLDTQSCRLDSDDNNSKYADWNRSGTSGDVYSHEITKDTEFTLRCILETGMEIQESVTVTVE